MRKPQNNFLRKDDLIYQSRLGVNDGVDGGLQASASDRSLASQVVSAIKDIQVSEDNLRRSIAEQQNKVLLLDATNKLSEINMSSFQSFAVDPEGFKKETTERSKEVFDKLPFQLREVARNSFLQQQSGYYYKALNNQREYLDKQSFEQTQISIQNLAKDASSSIVGLFNANQAANVQSQISLGASIAEASQYLNAKNSYGMDLFSPLQKQKISQGFYGTLFEGFSELKFSSLSSADEKERFIKDVLFGSAKIVYKDPTTNTDVEIPSSMLDQDGRNSIARSLSSRLKNEIKAQKEIDQEMLVKQVIAGGTFPDPKDKNYRDSVDTYYEKYVKPNIVFDQPLESLNLIGEFVNKTKTIPKGLESDLRACLSSDNFMIFSFASDVVKNITVNNPNLIDYLPEKDIAKALTMNRMTSAGVPPEEAFNSITKSFASISNEVREQRIRTFNKNLNDEKTRASFEAEIMESGWFWWKENQKPVDIVADEFYYQFTDLARDFYVMGADFDTARESALACMKKRWGNSVVNGDNTLTALPPEKYYSDYPLTGEIMRDLLLDYVKDKLPEGANEDNVIVLADRATYATAGNPTSKPSYVLCYINEMGVPEPILGDDLSTVRIGENVWNKEARFMYEQKKFKGKNKRPEIDLIELFEAGEF
jgi:hypothetical protein